MKTFGLLQKCVSSGVKIDGSTLGSFSMVQAIRSGEKNLPEGLTLPPIGLYQFQLDVSPKA